MKTEYNQPDFYRFSEDSTKLVHFIHKNSKLTPTRVLDLGAGCGVIGLELTQYYPSIDLTLLEGQSEFLPYLQENAQAIYPKAKIVHSLFSEFHAFDKFDLIVSNPPYFMKGDGRVSPSAQKQMARTWEKDSLEILIQTILSALASNGEAWLSLRQEAKVMSYLKTLSNVQLFIQSESLIYVRVAA